MRKTRVVAMVIAVILLTSFCFNVIAANNAVSADEPTIVVSKETAEAGGKAYVTIGLENNPGIVSMTLHVSYDTDMLTLTDVVDAGKLGDNINHNNVLSHYPYVLAWANDTATTNLTVTGTIVTLEFTVSEAAENGDVSPVEVTYDNPTKAEILNKDAQTVDFAVANGSVTVGKPGANSIGDFTYEISGGELVITGYVGARPDVTIGSSYTIGGVEYTVTEIAEEAFSENDRITSVVIPETVKAIGDYAFYDCPSLKEVTILSKDAEIGEVALGYYPVSRREDGVVEGFTIKGYAGSTAEEYANADDDITFVELEEKDEHEHTGGTATCKDKAVCSVCGESYGELNPANHAGGTEKKGEVNPSCSTDGYTGDTYCLGCGQKIEDGTVIPATGDHVDADGKWESNGTQHFHTCACGETFDFEDHKGGEATCKDKAVCSVCGESYGELNPANHAGGTEKKGEVTPSCSTDGYTGDTYCLGCGQKIEDGEVIPATGDHVDADGKWESNGTQHFHTCACGETFDFEDHKGGEATCVAKAICSVCGVAYGDLNPNNHVNTEIRDAVEATCVDEGYSGDKYCKDCGELVEKGTVVPATNIHVSADGKWGSNETQHFHICDVCDAEFGFENHTGGEATCVAKAACAVCGTSYGELNPANHTGKTYLVGQKETTCYEEGYTGDEYCAGCDELVKKGQAIPKSEHSPASVWSTDEDYHWHECEVIACGNIIDKAAHSGGEATCVAKAICSVCGVVYGDINPDNHVNTEIRDAVEATCVDEGYTGDKYCKDCGELVEKGTVVPATNIHVSADGKWGSNETQHFHTCDVCGEEFDSANHTGGEATCVAKAICSVCGAAYGDLDPDKHGDTEIRGAIGATCTEDGYTGDTYCVDCGVKVEEGTVIPGGHLLDPVPAVEATHEADGNIAYYICVVCEKLFSDETAATEITIEDTVIAKGEHDYGDTYESDAENHWKECDCGSVAEKEEHTFGEWVTTKEATETESGSKEKVCSVCGYKVTEAIPATGTDTSDESSGTDSSAGSNSPETGDDGALVWVSLLIISGGCLAVCTASSRKKKYNR